MALAVALEPLGNHGLWPSLLAFMAVRGATLAPWYQRIARALR